MAIKAEFFASLCFYKILLDIYYVFYLRPDWCGISGVIHHTFESPLLTYVISWITFVLVCGLFTVLVFDIDRVKTSVSQQILLLLIIMSVIPVMSLFGGDGLTCRVFFYYIAFFLWLLIWQVGLHGVCEGKTPIAMNNNIKKKVFWIIGTGAILVVIWTFFYYLNGNFFLDGLNVYGQRAIYAKIQSTMPGILVYALGMANIVEIFLLLYCFHLKKYKYIPFLLIVGYMHFSLGGEKTVIFSILLTMVSCFIAKIITMARIAFLSSAAVLVLSLASILNVFCNINLIVGVDLLRRVLFLPALLQEQYVDFFSNRTPAYWGINPEYNIGQGIENIISDLYYSSSLGHANNGLLGDCFANMGEYGIVVYPIILAFILLSFDWAASGKDARLFLGVVVLFVTYMVNGMLTTVMFSHGGLMMMLLLWLFPEKNEHMNDM